MSATPRRVVLCADDYGIAPGVSRGIRELAEAGRISATSVMTNGLDWPAGAPGLKALDGRIGIGLHLNLTAGAPLGPMPRLAPDRRFPPLGATIRNGLLGRLDPGEIGAEIERQLAAFEAAMGRRPDFLDGHQHVHVVPGVRQALLRVLASRSGERPWLRDPSDRLPAILARDARPKAMTVGALATGFRRAARAAGLATNDGFSGFSPLDAADANRVAVLFERAFARLGPKPLVMCHPGHVDGSLATIDPVLASREAELRFLASDAFGDLLKRRGLALVRSPLASRDPA